MNTVGFLYRRPRSGFEGLFSDITMADFKTHLAFSTVTGVGYGTVAHVFFQVPPHTSILAGTLCSLSGMLPDIDSNKGRPLKEIMSAFAAMVPMLMLERMRQVEIPQELIVVIGIFVYFLVRFGLSAILRKTTVHRGMFHSIPMAIIFGELAFLLTTGVLSLRIFKAAAVTLGYLSHLFLDEVYSIQWKRGLLSMKKSSGTAMKVYGKKVLPTVATYLQLGLLTFLVIEEPNWVYDAQARSERWNEIKQTLHIPGGDPPIEKANESFESLATENQTTTLQSSSPPALPSPSAPVLSSQPAAAEPPARRGLVPVRRPETRLQSPVETATQPQWDYRSSGQRRY